MESRRDDEGAVKGARDWAVVGMGRPRNWVGQARTRALGRERGKGFRCGKTVTGASHFLDIVQNPRAGRPWR
jgi:hypothetical protein